MLEKEYSVLMPMRNEVDNIEVTLECMVLQTLKPHRLYVLDDGSTDGSSEIVERFAGKYSWVEHIRLEDRGFDHVGQGVAEMLNFGVDNLIAKDLVGFVAKVDADLEFSEDYFQTLVSEMSGNEKLAVCCGHPYAYEGGKKLLERHGDNFPSGTARLYRYNALKEIGFFVNSVGWDTVDLLKFQLRGYEVRTIHELDFHHRRRMGTRNGYIDGMVRDGRNAYLTGYVPFVFFCRAVFNIRYKPYILRTICMLWGYFSTYLKRPARVVSDEEYDFHKKVQWRKLSPKNILSSLAGSSK